MKKTKRNKNGEKSGVLYKKGKKITNAIIYVISVVQGLRNLIPVKVFIGPSK